MVQNPSQVTDYGSDGVLLIWIINQKKLFDGNIFYPNQHTLAYADRQLLTHFSTRLLVQLHANPAVAFGYALIVGQLLTMTAIYLWWVYVFKNPGAAVIATVAVGLSQIRFEYQVHLQMWSMQYWILGTLLLWQSFQRPSPIKIYLGALFLGLQFWESPLPVYFAVLILGVGYWLLRPKLTKHHLLGMVLAGVILAPLAKVYLDVSREFHFVRDIREAAHNAISVNDLWRHFASPGLYLLAIVAFWGRRLRTRWLWVVLGASLILALGPALKWNSRTIKVGSLPIPMPYALAYYVVPGFEGLRTPSRWLFVSAFATSGLAAAGFARHRFSKLQVGACLLVAVVGGTSVSHVKALPAPQAYPPVYQWLKSQPGKVIVELPVFTWPNEETEIYRMLYSLGHGKVLVNGYSGFTPPSVYALAKNGQMPSGVDYVIVHPGAGDLGKIDGELVWHDETTSVYLRH